MITFLKKIFLENRTRKLISLGLAIIIWLMVNHSITTTKTFHNVPVKIIDIPKGQTVEGLSLNNYLKRKITLTITGNKKVLDDLTGSDLELILDASGQGDEWVVSVTTKNLICINPDIDIKKSITKIISPKLIIKLKKIENDFIKTK